MSILKHVYETRWVSFIPISVSQTIDDHRRRLNRSQLEDQSTAGDIRPKVDESNVARQQVLNLGRTI